METILIYSVEVYGEAELVASKDIEKLRKKMEKDVEEYIKTYYGDGGEFNFAEYLPPFDKNKDYWTDGHSAFSIAPIKLI